VVATVTVAAPRRSVPGFPALATPENTSELSVCAPVRPRASQVPPVVGNATIQALIFCAASVPGKDVTSNTVSPGSQDRASNEVGLVIVVAFVVTTAIGSTPTGNPVVLEEGAHPGAALMKT